MKYVLSIDQGTSSTRSLLINENGEITQQSQLEHNQIFPQDGWVEHDPLEIKRNVLKTIESVILTSNIDVKALKSVGITNQRETVVAWNKRTGKPLHNAIVWQCRRTSEMVQNLKLDGYEEVFHQKTGLVLDAYFSGTKIQWLLNNVDKVRDLADSSDLAFGTIDAWIIFCLTGNHVSDASNASRTLLYDINKNQWADELCEILQVPKESLPKIVPNGYHTNFGELKISSQEIPITGVLGDQQAALFGQLGFYEGDMKTTYGTGNFTLLNTGKVSKLSKNGLLTTIGWELDGEVTYALEGSVFVTGAALSWLRDNLHIFENYSEIDHLAKMVDNSDGVYFVPAFVGLGAPYWDSSARGLIIGLTRSTSKANILHAALDSIAFQTQELIETMQLDTGIQIKQMKVDGGITRSSILMQKQANYSNLEIIQPRNIETTALGAGLISGLGVIWDRITDLESLNPVNSIYLPSSDDMKKNNYQKWKKAVSRTLKWLD